MEQKTYTLNDGRPIQIRSLIQSDKDLLIRFYEVMSGEALRWSEAPSSNQVDNKFSYPDYYINLVVVHDGAIVGYGEILKDSGMRDGELTIHIHQDYRGAGLGTAMMIMLIKDATDLGLHSINLRVASGNTRAVHLFRKSGFHEQYTKQEFYAGEMRDILYMVRLLNR